MEVERHIVTKQHRRKRKPATAEHRIHLSQALKGRTFSDAHKRNISLAAKKRDHSYLMGHPVSEEAKHKMSIKAKARGNPHRIGQQHTADTRAKMSLARRAWWKGHPPKRRAGVTSAERLDRHYFTANIALAVFERDDYTCQMCLVRGGILHADHIKSWKDYPDLRFELSNCRTLCRPCHYFVTFKRKMPPNSKWGLGSKRYALAHMLTNQPITNEET